jgi:hypothetical protein
MTAIRRILLLAVLALGVLVPASADAAVSFSDGTVASANVNCNYTINTISFDARFGGPVSNQGYINWWIYHWDTQQWVSSGWQPVEGIGANPLHPAGGTHGWFAMYAQYAHYVNGWEYGGEFLNVSEEGVYTNAPWCYL